MDKNTNKDAILRRLEEKQAQGLTMFSPAPTPTIDAKKNDRSPWWKRFFGKKDISRAQVSDKVGKDKKLIERLEETRSLQRL